MQSFRQLTGDQRALLLKHLWSEYEDFKARDLSIDMTRGKPCTEQLDLSNDMLKALGDPPDFIQNGIDIRNYGMADGIKNMQRIFSEISSIPAAEIIIGGNSSIELIFDSFVRAYTIGLADSEKPWGEYRTVKVLCPCPGYDRHFSICQYFGAEMIPIRMLDDGPDMDTVERLVIEDEEIRAIICVPTYSNPTGVTFSDEVVRRLANMRTAAPDFTIIWDNAYVVHHLYEERERVLDIIGACADAGYPDRPLVFMSTSKITFAGGGVSCIAGSPHTLDNIHRMMSSEIIGYNKINQAMHARFLKSGENILLHMKKHAEIVAPKFKIVANTLRERLYGADIARWSDPKGGYFVSFYGMSGTATRIVSLCREAGVAFTPAGAAFPYGRDPDDSHIRIAPTMPSEQELLTAMELFCVSAKIAALEQLNSGF